MNTLQSSSLQKHIHAWKNMQDVISSIKEENFPYEIEGLQGGLSAFFIAELLQNRRNDLMSSIQYKNAMPLSNASDFLLVVPTEKDAETLSEDLKSIFNDAEPVAARTVLNDENPEPNKKRMNMEENGNMPEILQLPWWGLVPYRAASTGSLVFGERAGVLSKLAQDGTEIFRRTTRSKIFITTQRSLQSPVPPKEYIKSLSLTVKKGEQFDPQSFASLLAERGYLRVPRVSVRGEFTLRGEVLDIFMPGEDAPHGTRTDGDDSNPSAFAQDLPCDLGDGSKRVLPEGDCEQLCREKAPRNPCAEAHLRIGGDRDYGQGRRADEQGASRHVPFASPHFRFDCRELGCADPHHPVHRRTRIAGDDVALLPRE